jgi:UDP-glucuronate decarboxylase
MTNPVMMEDLDRIRAALRGGERLDGATILVTGCAGFLGYYLMQLFVGSAAALGIRRVIGLDSFLLDRPAWLTALAQAHPGVLDLQTFDIATDRIESVAGARDARYVIHMASIASPSFYRQFPLETIDANVWGLRRLLDFYRDSAALRGFLFFSSSEIYGDPDPANIPTAETYRGNVASIGPRACYDEAKRFGETLCHVFAKKYGVPVTIARPFNNYGPGMRLGDRRLPADFAACVVSGRDIVIHSDGAPTRTFCYISDAISGYLACLLHGRFDVFNIGIERPELAVRDFASLFRDSGAALFGYTGKVRFEPSADADYLTDNPNRRCPVIRHARQTLGYDPVVLVQEGVHRTLAFLRHEAA